MSFRFELGQMVFVNNSSDMEESFKIEGRVEYLDEPNAYLIKIEEDFAWVPENELTPASV